MLEVLQGPMAGCRIGNKLSTLQGFLQVLKGLATKKQIIMVERSLNNTGGRITKKVFGKQMHKSMREQSSDFNNQRKWILKWLWSFWKALYFLMWSQLVFILWRALRHHARSMPNHSRKVPKTCWKNFIFGPSSSLEHARTMSKQFILVFHNMSYNIIWYIIITYDIIQVAHMPGLIHKLRMYVATKILSQTIE